MPRAPVADSADEFVPTQPSDTFMLRADQLIRLLSYMELPRVCSEGLRVQE